METFNVGGKTEDPRSGRLSNFSPDSFTLDGVLCASVEGLIQGIKWPSGFVQRQIAFESIGGKAKRMGRGAILKSVWWQGEEFPFGSPKHHALIERAIRAKFEQNPSAMEMLRSTKGMKLIHDLGHPEQSTTSLPAEVFCAMLTRIRDAA